MLETLKENPINSSGRVSVELSILQSSVVRHIHDETAELYNILSKYCKTFDSAFDYLWPVGFGIK